MCIRDSFCVVSAKQDVDAANAGEGRGLLDQRCAFCMMVFGAGTVGFYPTSARGSAECKNSVDNFAGAAPIRDMYCDGAREFQEGQTRFALPW
eukprot:15458211-Alexandrium_andersonii.AAC.1